MTTEQFREWLRDAETGNRLCYHTGYLGADRAENPPLHQLANAVWDAYQEGFVTLRQQLHHDGQIGYYAVRTEEISE